MYAFIDIEQVKLENDECYKKLKPQEPCFIIDKNNEFAYELIHYWALLAARFGLVSDKCREAKACAEAIRQEQMAIKHKYPVKSRGIFVLRAQDRLAPVIIRANVNLIAEESSYKFISYDLRHIENKATISIFLRIAEAMDKWTPRKYPD